MGVEPTFLFLKRTCCRSLTTRAGAGNVFGSLQVRILVADAGSLPAGCSVATSPAAQVSRRRRVAPPPPRRGVTLASHGAPPRAPLPQALRRIPSPAVRRVRGLLPHLPLAAAVAAARRQPQGPTPLPPSLNLGCAVEHACLRAGLRCQGAPMFRRSHGVMGPNGTGVQCFALGSWKGRQDVSFLVPATAIAAVSIVRGARLSHSVRTERNACLNGAEVQVFAEMPVWPVSSFFRLHLPCTD